ncbi:MAG: hypothetical protein R3293_04240 [Candidatus Promineifilaceae bacterium]|nr:hypothetical protein [Candidatus Promineifilaceae bacterium]
MDQYEFTLEGHIHERWFLELPDFTARHLSNGTTLLEGPVVDQAALYGVIMILRDSGLTLLSCRRLES